MNAPSPASALEFRPVPAFQDNYIWLLVRDGHAVVVDPGDARPVLDTPLSGSEQLVLVLPGRSLGQSSVSNCATICCESGLN